MRLRKIKRLRYIFTQQGLRLELCEIYETSFKRQNYKKYSEKQKRVHTPKNTLHCPFGRM